MKFAVREWAPSAVGSPVFWTRLEQLIFSKAKFAMRHCWCRPAATGGGW